MGTKNMKPTDGELEILQILWQKGEATVREVHEMITLQKDSGYTTTLKLMQIMYEKGLVKRDDSNKTHIYRAAISKNKTQQQILGKVIHTLFNGSAGSLVIQALGNHKPTEQEITAIEELLTQLKSK
jgi:predicted transcriptional regulator